MVNKSVTVRGVFENLFNAFLDHFIFTKGKKMCIKYVHLYKHLYKSFVQNI